MLPHYYHKSMSTTLVATLVLLFWVSFDSSVSWLLVIPITIMHCGLGRRRSGERERETESRLVLNPDFACYVQVATWAEWKCSNPLFDTLERSRKRLLFYGQREGKNLNPPDCGIRRMNKGAKEHAMIMRSESVQSDSQVRDHESLGLLCSVKIILSRFFCAKQWSHIPYTK